MLTHNPTIADGPEGVKALVKMLISQGVPKQKIEFKHIVAMRRISWTSLKKTRKGYLSTKSNCGFLSLAHVYQTGKKEEFFLR
jgi:hypothetical protein